MADKLKQMALSPPQPLNGQRVRRIPGLEQDPVTNGAAGPSDGGMAPADGLEQMKGGRELGIATWNVRSMNEKGKLENIKKEMQRNNINVLGLSEVRWMGSEDRMSGEYRIIHSGGKEKQRGVAIILDKELARVVIDKETVSDRMMMIKIETIPVHTVIIQVYMPTSVSEDEEIEKVYEQLEELLDKQKGRDNVLILGDWNAVVGEGREGKVLGKFGLGYRNERGEKLIGFCERRNLVITNTWFKQPYRRRYTWKQPGDRARYQIDYILVKQRYRNGVKCAKSLPGADCNSDHNMVKIRMAVKMKRVRIARKQRKWDLLNLKKNVKEYRDYIEQRIKRNDGEDIEKRWGDIKTVVNEAAKKVVGYKKNVSAKKPWVTQEMLDKMEKRRRYKNVNTENGRQMYRRLNNELRRETERAREIWWERECTEVEELDKRGRSDIVYAKIKKLSGNRKQLRGIQKIKDVNGVMLTEPEQIKSRWKDYVEVLYDKNGKPTSEEVELEKAEEVTDDERGPELLREEIEAAIKSMKDSKAAGVDGIPAEFWKALGDRGTEELVRLCQDMYETGKWPADFTRLVFIPLEKKENAVECEDHRTISLICHASKILLKVLTKRIEARAKDFLSEGQFGFRSGVGTRDAIGVMRMLYERCLDHGNDLYICYIDFEKAFDRVRWDIMMKVLKELSVDWRDRRMIKDLYMRQEAVVRLESGDTEPGVIGRGVRQGCPLSPLLFSIYAESMMKDALDNIEEGVLVGGRLLKDVRFADDQAMVSSTSEGLQRLMDGLVKVSEECGMKVNIKKTKAMVISKTGHKIVDIKIGQHKVEQVQQFKYLGATVTEDGRCEQEIKCRIAMAKQAYTKRKNILASKMCLSLRKRLVRALVWPVLLYGSETWTMRKAEKSRLEAFEMWIWRRMARVSWKDKKTNEEVLQMVGERRRLLQTILERKKNWIGHVLRGEGLLLKVIEGRMEGKRGRGRKRMGMLEDMMENSYVEMKRKAQNRAEWRDWMPWTCLRAEH